ncbi:MAG TPA: NAD(P)/FAD-dependent oxidoreductase [Pyrinomonadaceae bacterium]|nr:NAD(P)/FAD-dependent oxidoreductase [Pyrinomonadaceae bacterium]
MNAEVVVVGGGIGGLTVAALLAARGVDVCLLERESRVGGCAASFEKFGYSFEQGYGLYAGWEEGAIHHRLFSELPIDAPEVKLLDPSYSVRLPDQSEVSLVADVAAFEQNLARVFPECSEAAVAFYRKLGVLNSEFQKAVQNAPDVFEALRPRRTLGFRLSSRETTRLLQASQQSTMDQLRDTSFRFQRFVDVQLQSLAQAPGTQVSFLYAALALSAGRGGLFGIRGGASALATTLADSITKSGGRIRLNTPALRLAYSPAGEILGIDLLSGERVTASKAIISNLTIWDTYGKLVGLNRLSAEVRKQLKSKRGWGAYLLYLGWDETAAPDARVDHLLTLTDWQEGSDYDPQTGQLFFCPTPAWDSRGPEGKRAVTLHSFTDVDDWFTFHSDETDLEARDQQTLEACWQRLHTAMPELGNSIEVIDTTTPRAVYEETRRKLGMVGGLPVSLDFLQCDPPGFLTEVPSLFIVSDTVFPGGLAGLSHGALALANKLTRQKPQ